MPQLAIPLDRPVVDATPAADDPASDARSASRYWVALGVVLLLAAVYVYWHLGRGLVPHDDGAIGEAAERVMRGELPHRDFDDIYTGGLDYLNACGFRVLGISFRSMRLVLFAALLAWIPAVFYIATRFVGPLAGAAVTALAVAASVPNYPAPMPSWYNLFLATVGVALLLRDLEGPSWRWLLLAGIVGGLSILFKIVGLYYVAGVLLFLVHRAHDDARALAGPAPARSPAYATAVSGLLLLFVVALVGLIRHGLAAPELVHFVLPGALIATLLIHREWTQPAGPSRERFRALIALVAPFVIGIAIPLAVFLVPYLRSGAVGDLLYGVFVLPTKRFGIASVPQIPLRTMLVLIPLFALVAIARRWPGQSRRPLTLLLVPALIVLLVLTGRSDPLYKFVWLTARNLVPALSVVAIWLLARTPRDIGDDARRRAELMLVLCVTAMCSLVQFPFAVPIYLCYVAPLAVLLAVALHRQLAPMPAIVPGALLAFSLAFLVTRVNTSSLNGMGFHFMPFLPTEPLPLARGGIDVLPVQAEEYAGVNLLLRRYAHGGYTWASPDSPDIYFLTGLRNPTRSLFEFFDDPSRHRDRVLASLEARGVTAIVLNRSPEFSPGITNRMFDELARRYPASADVGRFHVRWRP